MSAATESLRTCRNCAAHTRGVPGGVGSAGPLLCALCGYRLDGPPVRGERRRKRPRTPQAALERADRLDFERYKRGLARAEAAPGDDVAEDATSEWLRSDPGYPLGPGFPPGRSLREDGQSHREAWRALLRRDPCAYCGERPSGTVDHVVPESKGGRNVWVNYAGACLGCNGSKSDEKLVFFLLKRVPVRVPRSRTPARDRRLAREAA